MLSLARNGYISSDVDSAFHSVVRKMYFRYDLLDSSNNYKQPLTTVTGGSISYDTTQQIKRIAKFTVQDDGTINYLSNRIKPWARIMMPDGGFAEFPLGVFLLSTPPRQTDNALVVTRQIDGYDQLQVLVDDKVLDRYTVTAGTNYISAVASLLSGAGITQTNLTATTKTLPTALDWKMGTPKLDIINALLAAINYRTLWFDENGMAVAQPYVTPDQRAPEYTYQDDANSVMYPQVSQSLDLFAVPNKWVCVVTETDRSAITSTYTNSNTNSPTSTVNRGRTIVKYVTVSTAPDQSSNDTYAQNLAYQDSQVYEQVTFNTAIIPIHSDRDCYNFVFSSLGITDKFEELSWSFDLKAGAQMKHMIQKVVSI